MVRIQRVEGRQFLTDRAVTLVSTTWTIRLGGPHAWLGGRYQHPSRVEFAGSSHPIVDHLFLARAAALSLFAAALLFRRIVS